jgi:short-subunit dehydrogenase
MIYSNELSDKKTIIFGASRGIGFNIASNLISKGSNVTISSGNEDNLNAALVDLQKEFPSVQNITKIRADLSFHELLEGDLNPLLEMDDKFDAMIISSAVLGPSGDFAEIDFGEWVDTFNVNIFGPAKLIQYFLKNNLIRKNGKIIVMSGAGSGPDPYFTSYSSTKHALNGFICSLAHKLSEKEIWINSVLPGSFNTRMNETRIERGPENIGQDNFELSLSRIDEDETVKYQKLHALIEFLCSSSSVGVFGRLISAQYDDWQNYIERLKNENDDLYKMIRNKD